MKKLLLIILCIVLLPLSVWAEGLIFDDDTVLLTWSGVPTIIGGSTPSSLTCTLEVEHDVQNDTVNLQNPSTGDAIGQSFQVGTQSDLCKVCVYVTGDGSDYLTLRIGSGKNLTAGNDLMEDLGTSAEVTGSGFVCITSTDEDTLSTGTTYWIGAGEDSGDLTWSWDTAAGYGSGIATYFTGASNWQLGNDNSIKDFSFQIWTYQ